MTSEPASEPSASVVETVTPKRSSVRAGLLVLVVLIGLSGAILASFHLWRDQMGMPGAQGGFEVENLRAELSAASARLAQLEARPAPSPGQVDNARLDRIEQELKAAPSVPPSHLATDVESLAKQVAEIKKTAADAATMLRLADRLEQVEASLRELQTKRSSAAALLLAVGQMRDALAAGRGFESEWRAVKVLAGDDGDSQAALESLKDKAPSGIETRASLAQRFDVLAPRLVRAEILPEGDGWWRRTAERLLSLVTIRREDGSAAGQTSAAIVARAQAALTRGDLAGTVAELAALTGAPAELAAPWSAEAKARLEADKAVSALSAHALALAGVKP